MCPRSKVYGCAFWSDVVAILKAMLENEMYVVRLETFRSSRNLGRGFGSARTSLAETSKLGLTSPHLRLQPSTDQHSLRDGASQCIWAFRLRLEHRLPSLCNPDVPRELRLKPPLVWSTSWPWRDSAAMLMSVDVICDSILKVLS